MAWQDIPVPMQGPDASISYHVRHDQCDPEIERVKNILNAMYDPADLQQYVEDCTHVRASKGVSV